MFGVLTQGNFVHMTHRSNVCLTLALGLFFGGCASLQPSPPGSVDASAAHCPAPGEWRLLDTPSGVESPGPLTHPPLTRISQVMTLLEQHTPQVILLGETHDSAEDHRWQLHVLAALHGRLPGLEIGFEMFRASQQPILDGWLANQLSESALLEQTEWTTTWGHRSELYLPLLDLARMHNLPVHGLNVEPATLERIARDGWDQVDPGDAEGITRAAPISTAHREQLLKVLDSHPLPPDVDREDYAERFIRAQSVWDRAMAQRLARAADNADGPVVGIVGRGHMAFGHGIPHQLHDLGVDAVWRFLPVRATDDCLSQDPAIADLVFGIEQGPRKDLTPRLQIGVQVDESPNNSAPDGNGLTITHVFPGSLAERAGLQSGDQLIAAAGIRTDRRADLLAVLDLQPSSLALALTVERDGTRQIVLIGGQASEPN